MSKYLKRILYFLLMILMMAVLSGCDDDIITLFDINQQMLSGDGYFRFMFEYDYVDDRIHEITYPIEFDDHDDEKRWNVYVLDMMVDTDDIIGHLERIEPQVVDKGKLNVVSGQWVYIYCPDAGQNSGGQGHITAKYDIASRGSRDVTSIVRYLEGMTVHAYTGKKIERKDILKRKLPDVVLFDVTGDGVDDVCDSRMTGSGMVRIQCIVYDPVKDVRYVLDGYDHSYSVKGVENGKLVVIEKTSPFEIDEDVAETKGTVKLNGDKLVFTAD